MSEFINAVVTRDDSGHYLLEWTLSHPHRVSVYRSDAVDGEYEMLGASDETTMSLTLPSHYPRQHFLLKTEYAIYPVAERRFALQGTPNLRDFGGYRTPEGQQVKWGKFYRSGNLSSLTESDKRFIEQLGIARIYDFRRTEEIADAPTQLGENGTSEIFSLPIGEGTHSSFIETVCSGQLLPEDAVEGMKGLYRDLALNQGSNYRQVLNHLQEEDVPLLIHCTAGKDRTGVGAALILLLLGVDRGTVMEDYLLTARYYPSEADLDKYMEMIGGNAAVEAALKPLMTVKPEYLQHFYDTIDDQFDSLESYFFQIYGLSWQDQQEIRERWLID